MEGAVQSLQDILAVFIRLDSATSHNQVADVNKRHIEAMKRFTCSFVKQKSNFQTLLLGLTAGTKKEAVAHIFADYWKDLTQKQGFRLKWEEFEELLVRLSRPNALGRLKLFETLFVLINRKYSKMNKIGFISSGLDGPMGCSMLVMLRNALLGAHAEVKWPVSAR